MVVTAIDNLFEWTRAGADVRLVAQVEQTTQLGIHAGGDVESLADLAGCRFAVDAPDNGFALIAKRLLLDAGVEVDYVVVGGVRERLDALLGGKWTRPCSGRRSTNWPNRPGCGAWWTSMPCCRNCRAKAWWSAPSFSLPQSWNATWALWCAGWRPASRWPTRRESSCLNAAATRRRPRRPGARAPARSRVDQRGLGLLTGIRRSLGMLPPDIGLEELCDGEPLLRATRAATVGN